jgi:hypothetical protein
VLVNVPAGSYSLSAIRFGYTVAAAGFANPVAAPATRVDFVATPASWTIRGETIAGPSFGSGAAVAGVTVRAGPYSAVSDAAGKFSITGVPNGLYPLSGMKGSEVYVPTDPTIVEVYGSDVSNRFLWNGPMLDGGVADAGVVDDGGAADAGLDMSAGSHARGCRCDFLPGQKADRGWLVALVVPVYLARRRRRSRFTPGAGECDG